MGPFGRQNVLHAAECLIHERLQGECKAAVL